MRQAITIIIFYLTHALYGQQGFRTLNMYTTQNGLSNNTINCIAQDNRGFLWIGTKEGLNRFDGLRFKTFFSAKEPASGLANNNIRAIVEYQDGQLLIATASGLSVFNTLSGVFENEKITVPELKAGSATAIGSLYKDKHGNLWINHSGKLDVLDSNLHTMYRLTDMDWASALKGIAMRNNNWYTDHQNRLWLFADTSSIQIIDFAAQTIQNNRNNPHQVEFLKHSFIRSGFLDENANVLWYAPWGHGLYRYDFNTHTQLHQDFGLSAVEEIRSVNGIVKTADGHFLCVNGTGCYIVNGKNVQYKQIITEGHGLTGYGIKPVPTVLYKSASGHLWMGTENGLFQLENDIHVAARLRFSSPGKNIPWDRCNSTLRASNGMLYVSALSSALIEVYRDNASFVVHHFPKDKNIVITALQEDKHGNLWVGTNSGFYRFDPVTKIFSQPDWLCSELRHTNINTFHCDRDGNIWIATREPFGLYGYSPVSGTCEKVKNTVTDYFEKLGYLSRISFTSEDEAHVWMVSRLGGGIIGYNKKTGEWGLYPKKERLKNLLSKAMGHVYADTHHHLWLFDLLGTGLIKYDINRDSATVFTRYDRLPSDYILGLCTDGADNLWILTEYGISRFDLKTEKVVFTSVQKPQVAGDIEFIAYDPLSKNIIAASYNQLEFYPADSFTPAKNEKLQPLIDKVWVNSIEWNGDVNGQSLKLRPEQRNISIDFTVVHFNNADKINFAYQLAGADHDWKYADMSRSAQYAVLSPGAYTFRIKLTDENGNWEEPFDTFSFTIVPWFWQTVWFKIAGGLLLAATSWLVVRRRINHIRHEAEMKQKMAETEMMALRAQMNPHFIFNCLNAIDNLIQTRQTDKATVYLARFARLIRSMLDSSKNNVVTLQKDMESLRLYLEMEQFRCNNKFSYELNADAALVSSGYLVPPMIAQPFIENAIHHGLMNKPGTGKKLTIEITGDTDYLTYIVTDNGVGRKAAAEIKKLNRPEHVSYGIKISSERLHLYNQNGNDNITITDLEENGRPAGTSVQIKIKVHET